MCSTMGGRDIVNLSQLVVCSDSYSALTSVNTGKYSNRQDIVSDVLQSQFRLHQRSLIKYFVWVAAHVGIEGNEAVDQIAKQALKSSEIEFNVPMSTLEVKWLIKGDLNETWQRKWDSENKGQLLYNIQILVRNERGSFGNWIEFRLRIVYSALKKKGKHESVVHQINPSRWQNMHQKRLCQLP